MSKKVVIFFLVCFLTACTIQPKPLTINQRYDQAIKDVKQLFVGQCPPPQHIDYYEALVRSMKYNLDYRLKLVNIALQAGQLDIATYTLFPALNMSGSIYSRSNDLSTSGITSEGIQTGLSSSTPRTLRSARMGLSWNILDFGMGYVKARQQGEKVLIAEEEARRQLQQLAQDVLVAYWTAYNAQQLINDTKEFQRLLTRSKNKIAKAVRDNAVPKETLLNYQSALLDGTRRLIQLKYKYDKAMSDLKHLLYLPLDQKFVLAPPPDIYFHAQDISHLDFQKTDAVTLVNHPELRSQNYQKRIADLGVKTVILQALPGITLNEGWNYNSNKFLLNNKWMDKELDIAWNLLNLASLPVSYRTANFQVKYEQLKAVALTMSALVATRYAFSRYTTLREEYLIAHKQTITAREIYKLNKDRQLASLASDQQVIMARLRAITSKMDEDLLLADLSIALGQLYLSVGVDILPLEIMNQPIPQAIVTVKRHFAANSTTDFSRFIDKTYFNLFGEKCFNSPYTLQLFGSYHLASVETLKNNLPHKTPVKVAKTKNKGRDWYVLTYGKFASAHQAQTSSKSLPKTLNQLSPWIRKTDNLTWVS